MIYIGQPFIETRCNEVRLISHIINEAEGKDIDLYYAVEPKYGHYLCYEQADAFVLPMLLRAVVTDQHIEIDSIISEKLLHNVNYGVLFAIKGALQNTASNYGRIVNRIKRENEIKIRSRGISSKCFSGNAVGTGCSLGVDSFSVIKKYLLEKGCLPDYRITHFTCFNVGAFGSFNSDETRASYLRGLENTKAFAAKLNMPVVSVDTNVHDFYPERDFNWSHTFLNMGCVLSLQKLWKKYLYASSCAVNRFEFSIGYSGHYEPFLLPNLSTESTELISADMEKSRSGKVMFIMNNPIVKQNLNVCIKEQSINDGMMQKETVSSHRNCGHCEKCLRTMLQLDIFGCLNEYQETFDLTGWNKRKQLYLAKVLACSKNNLQYSDIVNSINENYTIPVLTKLYAKLYNLSILKHRPFKRWIENKLN